MYEPVSATDLEELSEEECLELLERHQLGRIALVVDGQPLIFPISYGLSHKIITFRTAHGTKLSCAPGANVAFEIDDYQAATGEGWSVLVQGVGVDATTALDDVSWLARGASPRPVAPGVKIHRLAIRPVTITGRRFAIAP